MKLDILAFGAHPDDVEISASGTLIKHIHMGYKAGIADLTGGELGTRGNSAIRLSEAAVAAAVMGISVRENLGMADGFFEINDETLKKVITILRKYQPEIVLCNARHDRHPDHSRAGNLVSRACFLSGLGKIVTLNTGMEQLPWRPRVVYRYIQDYHLEPSVIVDISQCIETKMKSILSYTSQFYHPDSTEPETPISGMDFPEYIRSRAAYMGRVAGFSYGEGFTTDRPVGVDDITNLK